MNTKPGPLFLSALLTMGATAQTAPTEPMLQASVNDLLADSAAILRDHSLKTDLADRTSRDLREAPGIVHVLTRQELLASGAQTLQEAMMMVPGIALGRDVDDVVGLSIRGNWAEEGKCLVMLDGVPLNETSFGTAGLALQLPVENIERIEVINGPGSVMYGGFAALGVVNVMTRDASSREGIDVIASTALSNSRTGRMRFGASGSHRLSESIQVNYNLCQTQDVLSTRATPTYDGRLMDLADSSEAQTLWAYLSVQRRKLRAQILIGDRQHEVSDRQFLVHFRNSTIKVGNTFDLSRAIRLQAAAGMSWQLPWNYVNDTTWITLSLNTANQRAFGSLAAIMEPKKWLHLQLGAQGWYDTYRLSEPIPGQEFNMVPGQCVAIHDIAGFAEVATHASWGNMIAGVRMEHQSLSGEQMAPRIAYTSLFGRMHVKLLYAKAFKLPTMQNIEVGPLDRGIITERVTTMEAEVGFRANAHFQTGISAFRVSLWDPIVYVYDEQLLDNYLNRSHAATQGLEWSARAATGKMVAYASMSIYRALGTREELPEIALTSDLARAYQGIPRSKATASLFLQCGPSFRPEISTIWLSEAYAYQFADPEATRLELVRYAPTLSLNAGVRTVLRRLPSFEFRVGLNDVLDARPYTLSPYNNGSNSLPGRGRELLLSVRYNVQL